MANQQDNLTITHGDGYVQAYDVHYDDADGAVPIVLVLGGSSTTKSTASVVSKAESLRDSGFFAITVDYRGSGAGKTWIDSNGYTSADYGYGQFAARDLADLGAIINAVRAAYPSNTDHQTAALGASRGAVLAWGLAASEGETVEGIKMPQIAAICPDAFVPSLARGYMLYSKSGVDTKRPSGRAFALFEDISGTQYSKDGPMDDLKTALENDDTDDLERILHEGGVGGAKYNWQERAGHFVRRDMPIFVTASYDDLWAPVDETLEWMSDYPNSYAHFGAQGNHGATNVSGQTGRITTARGVFLLKHLKGTGNFTDAGIFDNDDGTLMSRVSMLIVPNNVADFQDETAPPYVDTNYSWTEIKCQRPEWLEQVGTADYTAEHPDGASTTVWLGVNNLLTSAGADGSHVVTQTWSTATTGSDVKTWIEAGNSASDLDTYISGRLTEDTEDFTVAWIGANSGVYAGQAELKLYAEASAPGAHLYCVLQHTQDNGVTWVDVADTWHIWPDNYTAGTIELLNLKFNLRSMYLVGGATNYHLRLRFRNYPRYTLDWVGSEVPVRFVPSYDDFTYTIYRGSTYPSRLGLPLHDLSTGRTDLYP